MRYRIDLSYFGRDFHGWQRQPNAITVQQTIEDALFTIFRVEMSLSGCGRTDTGVHARYFVAHFDSDAEFSKKSIFKLNGYLPDSISIHSITKMEDGFHARFDAKSRSYKYYISTKKNPFAKEVSWFLPYELDIDSMQSACDKLKNYSDFTSFSKLHTDVKTNNCKVYNAVIKEQGEFLVFTVTADRFLRNMVRAIMGTLVEIGRGKKTVSDFCEIIEKKDRGMAGQSAPAAGLFLTDIEY